MANVMQFSNSRWVWTPAPVWKPTRKPASRLNASHEGPGLEQLITYGTLFHVYKEGALVPIKFNIHSMLENGFFYENDTWTCYRRTSIEVTCSYTLDSVNEKPTDEGQLQFHPPGGSEVYAIHGFAMKISAVTQDNHGRRVPVPLKQLTGKRQEGPVRSPEIVRLDPRNKSPPVGTVKKPSPCPIPLVPNPDRSNTEICLPSKEKEPLRSVILPTKTTCTYKQIRFKTATVNNSSLRQRRQQDYRLVVELLADVGGDGRSTTFIKIGERQSPKLQIRGCSPVNIRQHRPQNAMFQLQQVPPNVNQPHFCRLSGDIKGYLDALDIFQSSMSKPNTAPAQVTKSIPPFTLHTDDISPTTQIKTANHGSYWEASQENIQGEKYDAEAHQKKLQRRIEKQAQINIAMERISVWLDLERKSFHDDIGRRYGPTGRKRSLSQIDFIPHKPERTRQRTSTGRTPLTSSSVPALDEHHSAEFTAFVREELPKKFNQEFSPLFQQGLTFDDFPERYLINHQFQDIMLKVQSRASGLDAQQETNFPLILEGCTPICVGTPSGISTPTGTATATSIATPFDAAQILLQLSKSQPPTG